MKSKNLLFLMLATGILSIASTCKKTTCQRNNYSFQINAKFFPDKDSINIGDTIFIELNEPTLLNDFNTNQQINYYGAQNLGTLLGFEEMLGSSVYNYSVNDFSTILYKGIETSNINPLRFREYLFFEENGFYKFKIAIIPQKKGIFRLGLSNAANVYTKDNPCDKSNFTLYIKETNQHLYYNQWNFGVTPPLPNAVYCLKVK